MPLNPDADIEYTSMTMSPEEVTEELAKAGYKQTVRVEGTSETPAEAAPAEPAPAEPAAETTTPAADAQPAEPETPPTEPGGKKRPSGTQRYKEERNRFRELYEREHQELETLRREAGTSSAAGMVTPPKPAEPPVAAPVAVASEKPAAEAAPAALPELKKPVPEDFDAGMYDPAYVEALADYRYDVKERARQEHERAQQKEGQDREAANKTAADKTKTAAAAAARERVWNERVEAAKGRHPDWDAAMAKEHSKPIWNRTMFEAARTLPNGAELIHYLATHPDEANEIHLLTMPKDFTDVDELRERFAIACAELGRIEVGPDPEPVEPESEANTPPAQAEVVAPAAPVAAAPPAVSAPPKKPTPPSTVGSRAATVSERLADLAKDTPENRKKVAAIDPDEWRKKEEAAMAR